jgi:hypothetical protein
MTEPKTKLQKQMVKRAFTGLAGSPLARIEVDPTGCLPAGTADTIGRRGAFSVGPSVCPKCGRKRLFETRNQDGTVQVECLSDATPICGYLMVYDRRAAMPPQPKRLGRPPKHGKAMSPAERKKAERNREQVHRLIKEQKVDRDTDGRGSGMLLTGAPAGLGKLVSVHDIESVSAAAQSKIPGIRRVTASGFAADDAHGADDEVQYHEEFKETEKTFQHAQRFKIRKKWTTDDREKEELARKAAPAYIVTLNPQTCLYWNQENRTFKPWRDEMFVCRLCGRAFPFESSATRHLMDMVTEERGVRYKPHRRVVL